MSARIMEKMRNLEVISPKNDLNSLNCFKEVLMHHFNKTCEVKIEKRVEELKDYFKSFKNFIVLYTDDIFTAKSRDWDELLENWEYCINFSDTTLSYYCYAIKNVIGKYTSNPTSLNFNSLTEYFESNLDEEYGTIMKSGADTAYKANIEKIKFALFKKCIVPFAENILGLKLDAVFEFCKEKWSSSQKNWKNCTKVSWKDLQKYRRLIQNIIENHEDNNTSSAFNSLTEYFKTKLDEEFEKYIPEF